MSLELNKLPPEALDVIRYLALTDAGAWVEDILDGTGLSERGFGKAIRRLVTRYYVDMPEPGFYALTANGRQAAEELQDGGDVRPSPPVQPVRPPADPPRDSHHARRLTVLVPRELVIGTAATIKAGFDAPTSGQPALKQPGRIILRLSAPDCDLDPAERPLEVAPGASAGPVQFQVTPHHAGPLRVRVGVYQLVTPTDLRALGGMFFDLTVVGFPTPGSEERQVLGAVVGLHSG